jgi:hypothetical protein
VQYSGAHRRRMSGASADLKTCKVRCLSGGRDRFYVRDHVGNPVALPRTLDMLANETLNATSESLMSSPCSRTAPKLCQLKFDPVVARSALTAGSICLGLFLSMAWDERLSE